MRLQNWLNSEIFRNQTGNLTADTAEKENEAIHPPRTLLLFLRSLVSRVAVNKRPIISIIYRHSRKIQ